MLEACGRQEAPASRLLFRLQREGLENDFSPLTARSLGPGLQGEGESSASPCVLGRLLWSKGFKGLGSPWYCSPGQPE